MENLTDVLNKRIENIKSRCTNSKDESYKKYGALGIKVCEEWTNDSNAFLTWAFKNGFNSSSKKIYRKDTNGDYSPENCLIMTKEEYLDFKNIRSKTIETNKGVIPEKCVRKISLEYSLNKFIEVYIIDDIAYVDRQQLSLFVFGEKCKSGKIRYYEHKTLKEHKDLKIVSIKDKNNIAKTVYDENWLKRMKINVVFREEKEILRFNHLMGILRSFNEFTLTDCKQEQDTCKNERIKYIDLLINCCNDKQKEKFLFPLKEIFYLEYKKTKMEEEVEKIKKEIKKLEEI